MFALLFFLYTQATAAIFKLAGKTPKEKVNSPCKSKVLKRLGIPLIFGPIFRLSHMNVYFFNLQIMLLLSVVV